VAIVVIVAAAVVGLLFAARALASWPTEFF
jgi:uncharacterized integral membrane protein